MQVNTKQTKFMNDIINFFQKFIFFVYDRQVCLEIDKNLQIS